MIHNYPYTDYHELNLDYIMNLALSSLGIHLEVSEQYLKLINAKGEEISKVVINYADTATHDEAGNDIMAYIISAGVNDNAVVFTKGDGTATSLTIPYAIKADQDVNGNAITSYVKNVSVNGDQLTVTFGDGSTASITIPYAVKARDDVNGKSLTSYASIIATVGDKLVLRDGNNNTIVEITVPYAVKASQDEDGDNIRITYGTALTTGTSTIKLTNKDNVTLSEITVPYAVKALKDNDDNEFLVDYAYRLNTNGNKITVESHTGRTLNEIIVPFANVADHSNNSIESVEISGDQVVFTTYGGQSFAITVPYAVKALKDNLNNTLSATYIANVTNDPNTGKISFFAQDGTKIAELTPTVDKAVNDSYNNLIADYIKSIVTDPNSNYMTVVHGTGDADTILINYATHAYKDTYDNVIGNTYIRNLAIVQDQTDNKYYLVAYNGELSELFRIAVPDTSDNRPIFIESETIGDVTTITSIHVSGESTELSADDCLVLFNAGRTFYHVAKDEPGINSKHLIDNVVYIPYSNSLIMSYTVAPFVVMQIDITGSRQIIQGDGYIGNLNISSVCLNISIETDGNTIISSTFYRGPELITQSNARGSFLQRLPINLIQVTYNGNVYYCHGTYDNDNDKIYIQGINPVTNELLYMRVGTLGPITNILTFEVFKVYNL